MTKHRKQQSILRINGKKKERTIGRKKKFFIWMSWKKIEEAEEDGSHFQVVRLPALSKYR